ncbi:MAG TPA: hypothetical protein VL171_08170 [Verrucomicrobiae bacterium]|nr:hypothetical protein [Verrucomicrobiae bacterium]
MKKIIITAVALIAALSVVRSGQVKAVSSPVKPVPQAKSGVAVAFANVDILDGSISSFGGKGTKSAFVSNTDSNSYAEVTFTGHYPHLTTPGSVVVNATCQSTSLGVASANVNSVSPTQLVITVYGWISNTGTPDNETISVTAFLGNFPPPF